MKIKSSIKHEKKHKSLVVSLVILYFSAILCVNYLTFPATYPQHWPMFTFWGGRSYALFTILMPAIVHMKTENILLKLLLQDFGRANMKNTREKKLKTIH
jgi:hypothetical protein